MSAMKLTIIRPLCLKEIPVEQVASIYAPNDSYYLLNDSDDPAPLLTKDAIERDRDYHKARYENVLKGLNYWKSRALGG